MIFSVKAFSDAAITCIYPGIKVRLKLITIQDITNISALNCDSILGCSSSSLFLLYRIFSKSDPLRSWRPLRIVSSGMTLEIAVVMDLLNRCHLEDTIVTL